jgi:hypothetical protein
MKTSKSKARNKAQGFIASLAFLGIALSAGAQNYSIDWHKIAGGGGTSTNGAYQVDGTIGQPDTSGAMTGSHYSMTGGFWSLISVVQSPGMPTVYISSSGNTVTVYWQNVPGCALEQSCDMTAPAGWTSCPYSPATSNGTNYVNITCPTGSLFFRLCRH